MSRERPPHHDPGGGFRNPPGSPRRTASAGDMWRFLLGMPFVRPPEVPPEHRVDPSAALRQVHGAGDGTLTWLGHAAFILRLGGRTVLTDPFLGDVAGPRGLGPRRFVAPAVRAGELPPVDVMVISHNHYDHLDTRALTDYPHKASTRVIVPLGLGALLRGLGYPRVVEQDWWDHWSDGSISVTALPAVHFSGRGPFDRNRTLWASFALAADGYKVWFAGDTALGPVFDDIGECVGPFDVALVPIGAYEPRPIMAAVHANPEEAVTIARAVRARRAVAMHWGTIMLTPEPPFEAPARFLRAAAAQGYAEDDAWVLAVGETRSFAPQDRGRRPLPQGSFAAKGGGRGPLPPSYQG